MPCAHTMRVDLGDGLTCADCGKPLKAKGTKPKTVTRPHNKDDVLRMADRLDNQAESARFNNAPTRRKTCDEAAAMLRAYAEVVEGWRPIESAPTKGKGMILLLTPSRFPQVAFSNTWWKCGWSVECKPTHWMPIAELPEFTSALSTRGGRETT